MTYSLSSRQDRDISSILTAANKCRAEGRLQEAEDLYNNILLSEPANGPALSGLGITYLRKGDLSAARKHVTEALRLFPSNIEALNALGTLNAHEGNFPQSIAAYNQALHIEPNNLNALLGLGATQMMSGDDTAAKSAFDTALQHHPKSADAHNNLGSYYSMHREHAKAVSHFRQALAIAPDHADSRYNFSALLAMTGEDLNKRREGAQAIGIFHEALRLDSTNLRALLGLGMANMIEGRYDEAKAAYENAVKLTPESADALSAMGGYHNAQYELEKAETYFKQALDLNPDHTDTLMIYASLFGFRRDFGSALALLDRAIKTAPDNLTLKFYRAHNLLSTGNLREGFEAYEYGLRVPLARDVEWLKDVKIWQGEPCQTLLIHHEQGFGDALQFIRYAALCKRNANKVFVKCHRGLVRLFENSPYIDGVSSTNDWNCDAQIAMLSLPHIFKTTLETIPRDIPYLFVPQEMRQSWATKFSPTNRSLKVGLVWSGSTMKDVLGGSRWSKQRNMSLKHLLPLLALKGSTFYSLQIGEGAKEIQDLKLNAQIIDLTSEIRDMLDTAALIENLDLVITVDTSIAHLAGGLGKPVWVMSRYTACWRWLQNQPESPWYPSASVFGQPSLGDWDSVVKDVTAALSKYIEQRV